MKSDPTIYVVDDDPSVRRSLLRQLGSMGYRDVETFADPLEFLNHERAGRPACVIMDVMMPGLTGLEVQKRMAAASSLLPVIFITGYGNVPLSVEAMKEGAVDFLEKPFEERDLEVAVERALAIHERALARNAEDVDYESHLARLSPRERDVFELVVKGFRNKEIGDRLGITEKTVKVHRGRVMQKMDADSLVDLAIMAERSGQV